MKKLPLLVLVIILTLTIFQFSCHSPTAPKQNTPPDTTSNNFTWQTFTFGASNAGSSHLADVAIVSDSDIWCVGAIYLDSADGEPDPNAYNAVHWNGSNWQLERIKTNACGGVEYPPIQTIFAFSSNDILFAHIDGSISHYNGIDFTNDCSLITQLNGSANKIWGESRNDFYVVSSSGFIAHSQNGSWQKMESGTTIDLRDIWGSSDGQTVWACGYSNDYSRSILLNYDGTSWKTPWVKQPSGTKPPYQYFISSQWASDNFLYVAADIGIFRTPLNGSDSTKEILSLSSGPHSIRGSADNNIAIALDDGSVWHYNGASWFKETNSVQSKPLYSIAVSANTIVAVGFDATSMPTKGIILIGRRN